jgi:hypothetical protein
MLFFGLGIGVGWDDEKSMEISTITASIIVSIFVMIKSSGI